MPFSPEHPPKLVVFDLDNTLIACDSSQLWIDYLYEEGVVTDPFYKEENDRMVAEYHKGTLDIAAYLRAVTPAIYGIASNARRPSAFPCRSSRPPAPTSSSPSPSVSACPATT